MNSVWVYVMQSGKFIKVGIAADVERRLKSVAGGPLEVKLIAKRRLPNRVMALEAEKAIHAALKRYHHRREWFIVSSKKAASVVSRHCAKVRLAGALEARKPIGGTISLDELTQPKIPRHMKSNSALEQWIWKRDRRKAYFDALEREDLSLGM